MEENSIYIGMFGEFNIESHGKRLNENDIRSNQMIKLLAYLLISRKRTVSVYELCDVLWNETEIDNPAGALKNLVYRLRNLLKRIGDKKFILNVKGIYSWNSEIPVVLDFELFEEKYQTAKKEGLSLEEKIRCYEEAVSLYKGSFLSKYDSELWVIPLSTYYHSCYLSAVKNLAALYETKQDYQKMETLTKRALQDDTLDEELHYWVIKGLLGQNKYSLALTYYDEAKKMLYTNLGIRDSVYLNEVYEQLNTAQNIRMSTMDDICKDIAERAKPSGVFICEYNVFKEIYRLEARRIARLGSAEYIMLLTLNVIDLKQHDSKKVLSVLNENLERLQNVLMHCLRIGDVVTRCNDSQFIVLLQTCTFETGTMVAERILNCFVKEYGKKDIRIDYDLKEVSLNDAVIV